MNTAIQHPNHPRNLARFIFGIFAMAFIFAVLAVATGCRSRVPDVAASRLVYQRDAADGSTIKIDLWSPREVEIGGATINPATGELTITNYSAVPNQAALRARVDEVSQQREMAKEYLTLGKELGALAVLGWTGREARQAPGTTSAGPLSPEAVAQIVAALRAATNAPAVGTNAVAR